MVDRLLIERKLGKIEVYLRELQARHQSVPRRRSAHPLEQPSVITQATLRQVSTRNRSKYLDNSAMIPYIHFTVTAPIVRARQQSPEMRTGGSL
jgi:hypothetical protein